MSLLTRLAVSNNRKNRTRSILIILSIFLSTLLLTVIASWGYGIIKSQKVNADKLYGSYYGAYRGVSEEQLKQMKLRSEFSDIGLLSFSGEVENKADLSLYCADETALRLGNIENRLSEGTFPQGEKEIAAPVGFFEKLGYTNPKVGDAITLEYRLNSSSKYETFEFAISGLLKNNELGDLKNSFSGYVSERFYNRRVDAGSRSYEAYFRLSPSVAINYQTADSVLKDLAAKCGIAGERVYVNSLYIMLRLDPGWETIITCAVIAGLVIAFSVIVIYNIFQVGITQKIQEYGKLKAVGATKKQLKKIVFREGMLLAVIGIPAGLFIGYLVSEASFGWLIKQSDMVRSGVGFKQVSLFSLPILLLAAVLSAMIVWTALKRPMKIVGAVSAVEAMRYQEGSGRNKGMRKGRTAINVVGMTLANLSGNRRRTVSTVFTMGLSCVLFVTLANLAGNIDEKFEAKRAIEYGQFCISLDYSMNDQAYPENNLENILKNNPLSKELAEKISGLEGVKEVKTRKIFVAQEMKPDGTAELTSVSVLSKEDVEALKNYRGYTGTIDYDKAVKQDAIFYGWSHFLNSYGYTLNQSIKLEIPNAGRQIAFQGTLPGSFGFLATDWGITEDTYRKLGIKEDNTGYIWIDCEKKDIDKVRTELEELSTEIDHVAMDAYQDELRITQFGTGILKLGVYTFLAIIGLIGFMNMANTMITSIITRRQEFGILQAIGMTNKQLNRMLQLEGLIFTAGTAIVALAAGTPVGYRLFLYGKKTGMIGINIYHFPVMEIGIMIGAIALLQAALSCILSRNIKKASLVERIRYQE